MVRLFRVLAQLENGHILHRTLQWVYLCGCTEDIPPPSVVAVRKLYRTWHQPYYQFHTSGTSSALRSHRATVYGPQAGMSSTARVSPCCLVFWAGKRKTGGFGEGSTFYHGRLTMDREGLSEICRKRASSQTWCGGRNRVSQLELLSIAPLPPQAISLRL